MNWKRDVIGLHIVNHMIKNHYIIVKYMRNIMEINMITIFHIVEHPFNKNLDPSARLLDCYKVDNNDTNDKNINLV